MPDIAYVPSFCGPTGLPNTDQTRNHQAVAGVANAPRLVVIPALPGVTPYLERSILSAAAAVNADLASIVNDTFRTYAAALSGLTSYHRMTELAGNIADSGPFGITGTAFGAPAYGNAGMLLNDVDTSIGFNGLNAYFDLGAPAQLDFADEMTAFVVFRWGGAPGAFATDYGLGNCGDNAGVTWKWCLNLQGGTTGMTFALVDSQPAAILFNTVGAGLDDGLPHTAAITYKRNGFGRGYLDGVKVLESAAGNFPLRAAGSNTGWGCWDASGGGARFFLGDLQAGVTYNVQRSDAEIAQMHAYARVLSASRLDFFTGHPLGVGSDTYSPIGWLPGLLGGDISVVGSNATPINADVFAIQQ